MPAIDARFRTVADASGRMLLGADEAGVAALETALLHPDTFGRVAAHSVYPLSKGDEELLALVDRSAPHGQRMYVDWGRYDSRRTADLLDVAGFTRRLHARLRARGHRVDGREWPEGSALPFWSARALLAMRTLLQED